jgi:hypothetical protein
MPTRQTDSEYHRFLVEEILPSFDGVWKAPVTVHEVKGDLRLLAARVVIARQFESLRATYVLAATDLAHLAVAFIRHACDEYLWMLYLQHLTKEASNAVLVNMAYNDSFRGVLAARDFSSRDRMIRLGFGEDILDHVEEMIEETTNGFTHLGQRLGWPKKKQTPSTKWIAETVGEGALYDYLFSASSRAVHFSGHEVMRRGWVKEDDTLDVQDTGFRLYLSQLAIDVQIRLFLLTLKACGSLLGTAAWAEQEKSKMEDVGNRYFKANLVPYILPAEFSSIEDRLSSSEYYKTH